MTEGLRAILFDLDDTLLDWSGWSGDWEERDPELLGGLLAALQRNGRRVPALDTVLHEYQARTSLAWTSSAGGLRAPHLGDVLVASLAAAGMPRRELDRQVLLRAWPWAPYPGVACANDAPGVLQTLRENGIGIGLVTNSYQPMWLRDIELEQYGLLHFLAECRISSADVGWLKPHPRIFETALDCLGVMAQETIFVGDNVVADIGGAQNAGMRGILLGGQYNPVNMDESIKPDCHIQSLAELPAVLDDWYPEWRQ